LLCWCSSSRATLFSPSVVFRVDRALALGEFLGRAQGAAIEQSRLD